MTIEKVKKPLVLISGPTASGKTKSSILLAQEMNGEIISVDSMQVYKGMNIGTAKVTKNEMQNIPHYMIDEWEPNFPCSVASFKERVNDYIDIIEQKGKYPILVGGTGFYLNAILYDTQFESIEADLDYREMLNDMARQQGREVLHDKLKAVDPESALAIHPNNVKRVIRALEYYHETGKPISQHNQLERNKKSINQSPYDYTFFVLTMERAILYERINLRVDQMLEEGLLEEVKKLYDLGIDENLPSMKAIGYKEFFPYFKGEQSLKNCIDQLKQNTRNYAKRQLTWFRHQTKSIFIEVDKLNFNPEKITNVMLEYLKNKLKKKC